MIKSTAVYALLCIVLLAGCANKSTRFTNLIPSPTIEDQDYLKANFDLVRKNAETSLNRHFILYVPVSGWYDFDDKVATDELLNKYDGDVVTNLSIEKKYLILVYYNRYYVVVTGDVWRKKRPS